MKVIKAKIIGAEQYIFNDGTILYCYYFIAETVIKNKNGYGFGNKVGKIYSNEQITTECINVIKTNEFDNNGKRVEKYKRIEL